MTLADLLTELSTRGAMKTSRVPAMKTSLKYLAEALGHSSTDACPADVALRQEATWAKSLETYFATLTTPNRTISAYTRRNVRNDIRKVFKLAETHGLLTAPLPPRLLAKSRTRVFLRQQSTTAPYQTTYRSQIGPHRFTLPQDAWPPDIQAGWRDYRARCSLRLREATLKSSETVLAAYLGYLAHICGQTPTWEDCFDVTRLRAFVLWHGVRVGRSVSATGWHLACKLAAMAVILEHPARPALAEFRQQLPPLTPLHNKRVHHWVSLATLEAVAAECLVEGRGPFIIDPRTRNSGVRRALQFQKGVMLKLLVRVPLRQRNVRELRLEHNLYKDPQTGHWHLHFSGDELKIGARGGRVNEYHVNLTADTRDLVPVLEEFRREYRPRLPNATTSPFLFLTQSGKPYEQHDLYQELSRVVAMRTGQRFYPHLIRSIWATEYLEKTQDFTTAAVMLGDTLGTVMKTYYDVVNKDHHSKAKAFLDEALRTG